MYYVYVRNDHESYLFDESLLCEILCFRQILTDFFQQIISCLSIKDKKGKFYTHFFCPYLILYLSKRERGMKNRERKINNYKPKYLFF